MNTFFNTIGLGKSDLEKACAKAEKQNDRVLLIFQQKKVPLSPSQVWSIYQSWWKDRCPITSIRRSMTTMSATQDAIGRPIAPKLVKTGNQRTGYYNSPEHIWRLAE